MSAHAPGDGWPASPRATLEGRIVRLEPLTRQHSAGLRAAARAPEIWTWVGESPAASASRWKEWFEAVLDASQTGAEVAFATIDAHAGGPIGMTRFLALRPADRGLEIGATWLTPRAWSTGANVEAKLLQLTHAFECLRCIRVEFKTHAANARSRTALLALGARFEGVHRKHRIVRGLGVRDTAWYSVVDDEWPRVKELLRARLAASGGLSGGDEARPVA
jgi:RimJ/RimL family protein N-acetyltransferase